MSACSSAHDTSGSPAKISTTSMSSVTSNAPRTGRLKTYRATTSTNVRSIMARRRADAPTPRIVSTRRSHRCRGAFGSGALSSLARGDFLQLLAELREDLGGVDAPPAGLGDPVVDDRRRALP